MTKLDNAFTASCEALQAYRQAVADKEKKVDEALKDEVDKIHKEAMVLNTEEYFVRLIEENADGLNRKLARRQMQIVGKFEYTEIHQIIRERVKEVTNL